MTDIDTRADPRMLSACTVCGWPTDRVPTGAETFDHLAHDTPVCADCDACTDMWAHDDNCPQAPLPEVISLGDHSQRWMVASATFARGVYWPVRLIHVGGASVLTCACPHGQRQSELPVADQAEGRGCRHLAAVVNHENQRNRRPSMPMSPVSGWCD